MHTHTHTQHTLSTQSTQVSSPHRPRTQSPPPRRHHCRNHNVLELEARKRDWQGEHQEEQSCRRRRAPPCEDETREVTFPMKYKAPAQASKATATIVPRYSAISATGIRQREGEAASCREKLAESSRATACRTSVPAIQPTLAVSCLPSSRDHPRAVANPDSCRGDGEQPNLEPKWLRRKD